MFLWLWRLYSVRITCTWVQGWMGALGLLGICSRQGLIPVEEAAEQRAPQAVSRHCSKPVRIPVLACASVSPEEKALLSVQLAMHRGSVWPQHSSAAKIPVSRSRSLFVSACLLSVVLAQKTFSPKGWCIFSKLFVCETFLLTCLFNLLQLFFLVDSPQYSPVPSTGLNIGCFLEVKPQLYSFFANYELPWFLASYKHKNVRKNPTGWV